MLEISLFGQSEIVTAVYGVPVPSLSKVFGEQMAVRTCTWNQALGGRRGLVESTQQMRAGKSTSAADFLVDVKRASLL